MTGSSKLILDASVFIDAARRYYAFDLAPRFWESLVVSATNGRIESIDRIKQELERGKDELARWAKEKFSHAFASTNGPDVIQSYASIMAWAQASKQFSLVAKTEFAEVADAWLIAYAKAKGGTIVTLEALKPSAKAKIPIPNVCQEFGVPYIDSFEMLRRLGVQFA